MRIPEDISAVVLQTGQEEPGIEDGRITGVSNAPSELGREAVRRLVHILEHPEADVGERVCLGGRITIGETVNDLSGRMIAGE